MTVTVEIPMALPSAGNLHEHWRKRHQRIKAQRASVGLMLHANRVGHQLAPKNSIDALVVTLTRVAPRALDDDNLAFAFKGCRDEIAAYFGVNDNDPRVTWRYAQERGKPASVRIAFDVVAKTEAA